MDHTVESGTFVFQSPGPQVATEYPELNEGLNPDRHNGHILYPHFGFTPSVQAGGYSVIEIEKRISDYLVSKGNIKIKKDTKQRGFLIERLIREMYATVFNITDFEDEEQPYALVEVSNVDGMHNLSPVYARIREFRLYNVSERYSIDLIDFLNLPKPIADTLLNDSRIGLRQTSDIINKAEDDTLRQLRKEGINTRSL